MKIDKYGYNECVNSILDENECYGLEFTYDFETERAVIDYWILEHEDDEDVDNVIIDDSDSIENNQIYFPDRDYTYYTKDKKQFPTIEKMFVDRVYYQLDRFVKIHEQHLKSYKMVLNKSGYYRQEKLERLLNECDCD